jgi:hypothetical protein
MTMGLSAAGLCVRNALSTINVWCKAAAERASVGLCPLVADPTSLRWQFPAICLVSRDDIHGLALGRKSYPDHLPHGRSLTPN